MMQDRRPRLKARSMVAPYPGPDRRARDHTRNFVADPQHLFQQITQAFGKIAQAVGFAQDRMTVA